MRSAKQLLSLSIVYAIISLVGCTEDADPTTTASVTTSEVSQITPSSVTAGGEVTADGNLTVTERGVALDTDPNPTTSGTKFSSGSGVGSFTVTLSGLNANTVYHLRAYAINAKGVSYGETRMFTSASNLPALTTTQVSAITLNSAASGGSISSDGGGTITARGVCWSTSQNPTISDNKTVDGGGAGSFASSLNNILPSTTYYVRAYATNNAGTAYGTQISFSTLAGLIDVDGNVYNSVVIGTQTWMKENLRVSKYRNGDAVPMVTGNAAWDQQVAGAFCYYNNDSNIDPVYGKLYNWYAATDVRGLCPTGWHLPSDQEWIELENFLGGAAVAGGSMKIPGTTYWNSPNTGATNSSNFSAPAAGLRRDGNGNPNEMGVFYVLGINGVWWTATELNSTNAWWHTIDFAHVDASRAAGDAENNKGSGFSVRCIKD